MLGITFGDPAGIGPEITLKAVAAFRNPKSQIRIIGSRALLEDLKKKLKLNLNLESLVFDVIPKFKYQFGKISRGCGFAALNALEIGIELLKIGKIKGIVTAPVCKESLRLTGFPYPGQTEFFATSLGVKEYAMLAYSPKVKIIFVTTHKPLGEVSRYITINAVLAKIGLINDFILNERFRRQTFLCRTSRAYGSPQIAVFSLNPHSLEFSAGEEEKIIEAIKRARRLGINVAGPFPADTVDELINQFDGFVAMYHDQGMIPVKLLARNEGVNVTLGLPYPRTSPLHGCAFDIAGRWVANPSSMIAAIKLCWRLVKNLDD